MNKQEPNVIWKPNPGVQTEVLRSKRDEFEILFGGARAGGKTDAGIAWLSRWVRNKNLRALVIRINQQDLKDWIDRAYHLYKIFGVVKKGQPAEFHFPLFDDKGNVIRGNNGKFIYEGAIIYTGHLNSEDAFNKYKGQQYPKMIIEELTQIPSEDSYEKLLGSCRSVFPDLKAQVFGTTNPDGVGRAWVKRRWKIPDDPYNIKEGEHPPMERFEYPIELRPGVVMNLSRIFVPSKVDDNPAIINNDPRYVAWLNSISDEATRMQWRYGSWATYEQKGAYYGYQMAQAEREDRICKVPYIPSIPVDTWWDLGVSDSTSIWFTQSVEDKVHVIDYFEDTGKGLDHYIDIIRAKGYRYRSHNVPHDADVREWGSGKTRREMAFDKGITLDIVTRANVQDGIQAVREVLASCYFDEANCNYEFQEKEDDKKSYRGLESLRNYRKEFDDNRQDYKDIPIHDWTSHGADAFRYLAIGIKKYIKEPGVKNDVELIAEANKNMESMRMRQAFTPIELPTEEDITFF